MHLLECRSIVQLFGLGFVWFGFLGWEGFFLSKEYICIYIFKYI